MNSDALTLGQVHSWSYAACAVAYAVLSFLLLTSWKGKAIGGRLIVCCLVTAAWAAQLALQPYRQVPLTAIFVGEVFRSGAWLWFISELMRGNSPRFVAVAARIVCPALLLLGLITSALQALELIPASALNALLPLVGVTLACAGLVAVEQLYRNTPTESRKGLPALVLAVGASFAYDLFLYSQTELLRTSRPGVWAVRGLLIAGLVPMLAVAIRRNIQWSLDVFISRQVVFHTTSFLAVGLYLLVMALGGYYLRAVGGTWGSIAEIVFFAGAMFAMAALLFSEAWRRRLKVFISKHFYSNKYDYRLEWLRFIDTLSQGNDMDVASTSVRAVSQLLDSPGGALYELDRTGGHYVVSGMWPTSIAVASGFPAISASHSLTRFLTERAWVIDLSELVESPDKYAGLEVPELLMTQNDLRLISPIMEGERLIGFFALYNPRSPFDLTFEDHDLLKTAGRHVATQLAQLQSQRELAETRQFQTYNRFITFTMHDLKNSVAQLNLVVANAERHKTNPEFVDDVISTVRNASHRMTRLMEHLHGGEAQFQPRLTQLGPILQSAIARCVGRLPLPRLTTSADACQINADAERLTAAFEHLIRNAQEATADTGAVSVDASVINATQIRITVSDTGSGMDMAFIRDRLFQPFDSTKGAQGMGIGAYQVREYVQQAGGTLEVSSSPGNGTIFCIRLAIATSEIAVPESSTLTSVQLDPVHESEPT